MQFERDDDIIEYVKPFYDYSNDKKPEMTEECENLLRSSRLSEDLKSRLLQINIHMIEYFVDPSDALKRQAIKVGPNVIRTMEEAGMPINLEYYMYAYEVHDFWGLSYMNNIPIELQKISIEDSAKDDNYCRLPLDIYSYEMQKYAIEKMPRNIQWIEKPVQELIELAIDLDPSNIRFVIQTDDLIKRALRRSGIALQYVRQPTTEQIETAIMQNGIAIRYVHQPNQQQREMAIRQNGDAIKFISDPTELEQEMAIRKSPGAIAYLINDSKKMKRMVTREQAQFLKQLKFLAVELDPEVTQINLPEMRTKEMIRWANLRRVQILRMKLCEVCINMQPLELPALLTMLIFDELNLTHTELMTDHDKWQVIALVKHYQERKV